jgi:hypothetical protein
MWDILTWVALLALGGALVVIAGAIFIWALFWVQEGGENE